jgi:methionyl-tRNA formyltransferase
VNVAILSGDAASDYTGAIARRLVEQGDSVSAIVVVHVPRVRRARLLAARVGLDGLRRELSGRLRRGEAAAGAGREAAAGVAGTADSPPVDPVFVESINGPAALEALRAAAPDLILYTGGGIVRDELLAIPTIGVLNAHMGLLPGYRGMNALEWSLLHGDPLGITIHFIDSGIDTGEILLRRELEADPSDTIESLRAAATLESADALAEAVRLLAEGREERTAQSREGKQYFVMHARLKGVAEARLRRGA